MNITCPGSGRPPIGTPAHIKPYQRLRGVCPHCNNHYPVRADGTLRMHRSQP